MQPLLIFVGTIALTLIGGWIANYRADKRFEEENRLMREKAEREYAAKEARR